MASNQVEELNKFQSNEVLLQFNLLNGEELQGRINWYDNFNINISVANKKEIDEITIPKHAIIYYFAVS